jgi:hypothetical protein
MVRKAFTLRLIRADICPSALDAIALEVAWPRRYHVITGAADDDPSGSATCSVAGAQLGTKLLWTALLTWPLMAGVQMMCARIGMKHGSQRKAEAKLANRQERVEKFNIRDLDPRERERFSKQWESVQSRFVDSPKGAVSEADDLVSSLMSSRGYPVSDFDQRAADISVDHPRVVENYRSAHGIALRVGNNGASTEDLRTAMIHYRSLFEELVQVPTIVERKEVA